MHLHTHTKGFQTDKHLMKRIDKKIWLIFGRFASEIHRIDIDVTDINGPKGGPDKRCRLNIKLKNFSVFTIQETALNVLEAINSAGHRGKRKIERLLSRRRDYRQTSSKLIAAIET